MKKHLSLGVCDYPEHVSAEQWPIHARKQKRLGLDVVRLAEFSWAKIEPRDGEYDWQWLDDAIHIYQELGLQVVLGTPTATPPAWLVQKFPEILAVDENGHVKKFGSRRHYDHASPIYRKECQRIVKAMAMRYGKHPALAGWQTDNELGHEGTTQSYGGASVIAFRQWLENKYSDLAALNQAWGNAFWSQDYSNWQQIDTPNLTAARQPNPSQVLDFKRFCSDMVIDFQQLQIDILRELSPERFVTHNFVIFAEEFDLYKASQHLDFVSWDSYPIGMLELFANWESEEVKTEYARTGYPDLVSLNHDIYRGLKGGKDFWVMEQQCGHANWADYNPLPADGAVKLWTAQAWAHGAENVVYFRWRACHYAQEIMHSGLLQQDGREDRGFAEVDSINKMQFALEKIDAKVALLHDYESQWAYNQQPHHKQLSYWTQFMQYYSALRALGVDVDIIHPSQLGNKAYKLVVAPALCIIDDQCAESLKALASHTPIVFGPRAGSRTNTGLVPENGQLSLIEDLVGIKLLNFDSLRPGLNQSIHAAKGNDKFSATLWAESYQLEGANALYLYSDGPMQGKAAVTQCHNVTVVGALSKTLLTHVLIEKLSQQGIETQHLPEGVRISRRGNQTLLQNFNQHDIKWQEQVIPAVSACLA